MKLDEEIASSHVELVELLLVTDLRASFNWFVSEVATRCDNSGKRTVYLDGELISRLVEVVTAGARRFDYPIPRDKVFRFDGTPYSSRLSATIQAARAIAKSGAAGQRARELEKLIGEVEDAKRIWLTYCEIDELGDAETLEERRELGERNGVDGFVQSYLLDGVPLEDILV